MGATYRKIARMLRVFWGDLGVSQQFGSPDPGAQRRHERRQEAI